VRRWTAQHRDVRSCACRILEAHSGEIARRTRRRERPSCSPCPTTQRPSPALRSQRRRCRDGARAGERPRRRPRSRVPARAEAHRPHLASGSDPPGRISALSPGAARTHRTRGAIGHRPSAGSRGREASRAARAHRSAWRWWSRRPGNCGVRGTRRARARCPSFRRDASAARSLAKSIVHRRNAKSSSEYRSQLNVDTIAVGRGGCAESTFI
jgi:hypothetical protein